VPKRRAKPDTRFHASTPVTESAASASSASPALPPSPCALDASALLAYLAREPGFERVKRALSEGAHISAVNLSEVYAKLISRNVATEPVAVRLRALGLRTELFDESAAGAAASLFPHTRPLGLSLGDRAALALAIRLRLPILTTDRIWSNLNVSALTVEVIR
jgi:ribonuclease VapC